MNSVQPAADPRGLAARLAPFNDRLAPLVRAGLANPLLFTPGITVLEVRGRKTGQHRSLPLACLFLGPFLVIGTVRPGSQWIRNLKATSTPAVWLWGRRRAVAKTLVTNHVAVLHLSSCR